MARLPKTKRPAARPRPRPRATLPDWRKAPRKKPSTSDISISLDARILDDIRRLQRKTGISLDSLVAGALVRELKRRRLQQMIADYEVEHGVITEAELAEVRAKWQG